MKDCGDDMKDAMNRVKMIGVQYLVTNKKNIRGKKCEEMFSLY